jgi:hypothetical protein
VGGATIATFVFGSIGGPPTIARRRHEAEGKLRSRFLGVLDVDALAALPPAVLVTIPGDALPFGEPDLLIAVEACVIDRAKAQDGEFAVGFCHVGERSRLSGDVRAWGCRLVGCRVQAGYSVPTLGCGASVAAHLHHRDRAGWCCLPVPGVVATV